MEWTRGPTIGHGSTATVSLATTQDKVFAVKSAELSNSEFLQREAEILSSINSPHIIGYMGCDITRENNLAMYNILLEYMAGGNLSNRIRSCRSDDGGVMEELGIGYYIFQIVKGLEYLQSHGLVHCDIKPTNILIGHDNVSAKIADFGCAKLVEPEDRTIRGTPMYMAPEVARGEHQGFESDIWSLGCTIIEMASGVAPWPNESNPVTILYRVGYSGELPECPVWLSEKARDFLSKCLMRDPKERWTASQLLEHPFLVEFNSQFYKIQESNSSSPTSILDQGFWNWNSVAKSESFEILPDSTFRTKKLVIDERVRQLFLILGWSDSFKILTDFVFQVKKLLIDERIKRLSLVSGRSDWEVDDNWVTVRHHCNGGGDTMMNDVEAKDTISGNELLDLSVDFR